MLSTGIIKRAIQEAEKSSYKIHIGAVIFKNNSIISSSHNQIRSSRISNKHKDFVNSLHAEQAAILKVKDWSTLKGCSILVVKVSNTLKLLSNAMPCNICQSMLSHVGIKNIFYSDIQGQIIKFKG